MAAPNEKLAESLQLLHAAQSDGILRATALSRTHRERLIKAGFLQEVIRGWFIVTSPAYADGSSTAWYASFWTFTARYLADRFGTDYCLSPEASVKRHVRSEIIPQQVIVMTTSASNQLLNLCFDTSLMIYQEKANFPAERVQQDGLRLMDLPAALCRIPPAFFKNNPSDAEIALRMVRDPTPLLRNLLEGGNAVIAGRLAGAYEFLGEAHIAREIKGAMEASGYSVRPSNPFDRPEPALGAHARITSPQAARIAALWATMRPDVLRIFPAAAQEQIDIGRYLSLVEERYEADAYNSLSIEGYQVSPDLIQRVRQGNWNPDASAVDGGQANALAARGYFQAFQAVKRSLREILQGESGAEVAARDHQSWYREMFSPAVIAGILSRSAIAGYRSNRVYLRGSRHVPPAPEAVLDSMEALFEEMRNEPEASVRAVLGHFLFGYVHPYPDGNGRIARFLMNAQLASGGYPWTVIRQERRRAYLDALERASTEQAIRPFAEFIQEEMLETVQNRNDA